ncbi:lasso RiPP family leader peptide-containing protein [Streptomyces sp. NPDC059999]
MNDTTVTETTEYVTPALADLGTVTEVTLGSNGGNNADDTQYWQKG